VVGKGRHEVRLPLPQDAGEAVLRYLKCRLPVQSSDRVFVRHLAPFKPVLSGDGVSNVVKRALRRVALLKQVAQPWPEVNR
jgi:site-specific recombinase XerC